MGPIPVTVVSGFLGAGKTTLINRVLGDDHEINIAVLVNDIGAIDVDAELIKGLGNDVISLKNGCVCCSIRGDLVNQLAELARDAEIDHIIIEASGASEPGNIVRTLNYPELRGKVFDAAVITMVDTEQFPTLTGHAQYLAGEQLAAADIAILNKIDLVSSPQVESVARLCACRGLRILKCQNANVPLEVVFSVRDTANMPNGADRSATIIGEFQTATWIPQATIDIQLLRTVLEELPDKVIRVKGFVKSKNPDQDWLVQAVGPRVKIVRSDIRGKLGLVIIAIDDNTDWDSCFELLSSALLFE